MPKEIEVLNKKKDDKAKTKLLVEVGTTGTNIFDGYIDVDYVAEWNDLATRIPLINRMMGGDGTVSELLEAISGPILSAKKTIDYEDGKIKEFAERALFKELNGGFSQFLIQVLTFVGYGFSVFEEVYKVVDGFVYWDRLPIRQQSSIESWTTKKGKWIDGHPPGITQLTESTDEAESRGLPSEVEIPWDKLMLFSLKRVGNNFEGVSILRRANIHFQMKQILYKISAIAAERFGVGIPYMQTKGALSPELATKYDELLKNIRGNEQAFARYDEKVKEFGILTPSGNSQTKSIQDLIDHHDKKMYQSILAGFLNLTSGQGGSNALSKDQSSFFLKSIQYLADYIAEVIEEKLKKLIIINFGEQEEYPKLIFSDIGNISLDEWIESTALAKQAGLISWGDDDEGLVRERLGLGEPQEGAERIETKKVSGDVADGNDFSEKKNIKLADKKPTERERTFMRNIGDYENYLASEYSNVLKIIEPVETKLQIDLQRMYKSADTERVDGIIRLKPNTKLEREMERVVDQAAKTIDKKLVNSAFQTRLFNKTVKAAKKNLTDNNKFFAEVEINKAQLNSMIKGYITNVRGFLFNGPRQAKEQITLNFGSSVAVDLAIEQAGKIAFNRNIVKLSTLTHARGAYNMITYGDNIKNGFTLFKTVVPKQRLKDVAPNGKTASLLWLILLAAEITRKANKDKENVGTTDAMTGLNLHHGAFAYYYPISSEQIEEEEEIAKAQRKAFLDSNK